MQLLLGILLCICYGIKADESISTFYKDFGVVPDIYDETDKVADQILELYVGDEKMINGKHYVPASMYTVPTIRPPMNHDPNAYYTLVYISPDWYTREFPNLRHFLMWLVINIPGSDFSKGETIVEYSPPGPMKMAKAPVRYLYALYKQPAGKMTVDEPYTENRETGIRPLWSIKNFAAKHNLGTPVAVIGYETSYDNTVPQLHKEYMSWKKSTK